MNAVEKNKEKKEESYNHVLKYTGLLGGVQGFYILISIIRNKLTALLVGEVGMGLSDLYSRSIELLGNTTNFGMGFSAVRRLSELYETGSYREQASFVRTIRSWALLTAILGMVVGVGLSPLLSRWVMGNDEHTLAFALLAPAVAFATLTGGEMAILKGMRRLKQMAANSAMGALATLLLTAPLYAWMGIRGVIPVILATSAVVFFLNLRAAITLFPYRIAPFHRVVLRNGSPLIRLGAAYIAAGILGSGAEMLIRAVMVSSEGGLAQSGLYAAGLTLTVSYARLVFVAMDADYFPRLSAAVSDPQRMNTTINRQIDVLVLLMAPFLIGFALFLPFIIELLYTERFLAAVPMVICALPYMFFKAIYSPIAYLPLAEGAGRTYLMMELLYDGMLAVCVTVGFHWGGLTGAGIGLSLANLMDFVGLTGVYRYRYGFHFAAATWQRALGQGVLLLMGLWLAWQPLLWLRWTGGGVVLAISIGCSWRLLQKETSLVHKIKSGMGRFKRKTRSEK